MKDYSSLNKLRLMGLNLLLHNKMQRTIISSQMEIHKHVNSFCQNSTNVRNICPIFAVVLKQGKFVFTRYIISLPWKTTLMAQTNTNISLDYYENPNTCHTASKRKFSSLFLSQNNFKHISRRILLISDYHLKVFCIKLQVWMNVFI